MRITTKMESSFLDELTNNLQREEIGILIESNKVIMSAESEAEVLIVTYSLYDYLFLNEMRGRAYQKLSEDSFVEFIKMMTANRFNGESSFPELLRLFQLYLIETSEMNEELDFDWFRDQFKEYFDTIFMMIETSYF